jgi:hypothetical protein
MRRNFKGIFLFDTASNRRAGEIAKIFDSQSQNTRVFLKKSPEKMTAAGHE